MMLALRVPDVARFIIADQACSSVNWCRSSVACSGIGVRCGMRRDMCNSARTARRVVVSSGVCSTPIICSISWSVNCFIKVIIKNYFNKSNFLNFVEIFNKNSA